MTILRNQFLRHVGQTSPSPLLIEVERAEGIFFYTPDGKRYFDLISGVSVSNVGHGNHKVIEAVQRQAADYMHVMVYGETVERPQVNLAVAITEQMPKPLDSVYFVNSGAEAVEAALKLARQYTGRRELISCRNAYHGSTMGALSVQGGEEYKRAFRPLIPDVRHIDYNNFNDLTQITERTAVVLIEPVQGEAGVKLPAKGYLEAVRDRCTEVGALLIFDEIQTGFGRLGEMFALVRIGVTPDAVCLAKAMGGGMPLGGVVSSKKILDSFTHDPALGHITTFGGHPVSCAAGLAALEYIVDNDLCRNAERIGGLFEKLLSGHPAVKEIRSCGALMAVELGSSERLFKVMDAFADVGILSDWFLFCDTAFRISPPLTMTVEEVEECCGLIISVLDKIKQ